MAVVGTYYFDGASFATSLYLYTDAGLTAPAPAGWYSIGGIVRQVTGVDGLLGNIQNCVTCTTSCATTVGPTYQNPEGPGQYNHTIDVGSATGAIIVEVNTWGSNVGFTWTYDGVSASEYSNPTYGYLEGVIGIENPPTGDCSALPLTNALGSNGQTLSGNVYTWDGVLNEYAVGAAVTLGPIANQASGGVDLTLTEPSVSYMVIPKPNASPSTVDIQALVTCANADFSITVGCPAELTGVAATSTSHSSCTQVCAAAFDTTYYTAPVAGAPGAPAVYDWIFTDPNGSNPVADGIWGVEVNNVPYCAEIADGVIISLTAC